MIETAVILAAGMGSRIRERTGYNPKGFLLLDGKPLIEHSISKMLAAGIKKIFIGTGFMKEAYEELAYKYEQIQCVFNPYFETTGSMFTLYRLKDVINEDFLLVESDLIYEGSALTILMNHAKKDVILSSKLTDSGDEVLIEINDKHHLINMSKAKADLMNISGELVGITKLSYPTFQKICSHLELLPNFHRMDYENGIVAIADQIPFYVHQENDVVWCEVDDEGHWARAVQFIYPLIKARENVPKSINRTILLNPGPATTTDTVKFAQVIEDICPREEEFGRVMEFISNELTMFVGNLEKYTTVLFGGSGTAAVESILSSVIDDHAVLIINNGAYGKRMCKIADVYGLEFFEYASPVDEAIDLPSLERFIKNVPTKLSHLAVVHCETSTGLLNNLEAVGELCQKYNLSMIVDAMSSFAAIPIDMNKMNISYLAASSNKNLQGMAGVSFVIADKAQLEKTKQYKQRNVYLNLFAQYHYFKQTNQMQFTPPVQTLYALKQAILETKWEGIQTRYKRYTKSWETLIEGVNRLGLKHLVDENCHSRIITSIIEPSQPTYDFNEMHDYFYRNGFTIYPGKVNTLQTFRIANIGDISYLDIERFITLLERYLEWLKEGDEHETI